MTNDEKEYYEALINSQLSKDERMMGSEVFLEQANSTKPGSIQAMVLLLGAFIGMVISCGYLFIRYISAKHLRIKDDLEEVYHCPILGTIEIEKRRPEFLSFIDHWIDS